MLPLQAFLLVGVVCIGLILFWMMALWTLSLIEQAVAAVSDEDSTPNREREQSVF